MNQSVYKNIKKSVPKKNLSVPKKLPPVKPLPPVPYKINTTKQYNTRVVPMKYRSRRGMNWPGFKYLGPGNPLHNGEPVSKVDEIAQHHDWKYQFAESENDIKDADNQAISQFNEEWRSGREIIPGFVGASGLKIKQMFENFFGSTYPNFSNLKKNKRFNSKLRAFGLSNHKKNRINM